MIECLEELERVNVKFEKKEKEKEFKFTNKGCEKQFKFNGKMNELFSDKWKVELKKHFKDGLQEKVEEIIREGAQVWARRLLGVNRKLARSLGDRFQVGDCPQGLG